MQWEMNIQHLTKQTSEWGEDWEAQLSEEKSIDLCFQKTKTKYCKIDHTCTCHCSMGWECVVKIGAGTCRDLHSRLI